MGAYARHGEQYYLYELDRDEKKIVYKGPIYIWHACSSLNTRFTIDPDDVVCRGNFNRVSPCEDTVAFDRLYTKTKDLEYAKNLFIECYGKQRTELMDKVQNLDVIIGCLKKED